MLDFLSKFAPVVSAMIALVAAIFISRQIANIRRNREVDTLFKIIALSDTEPMRNAKDWFVFESHNYHSAKQLKNDKEALKKFSHIIHLFETMGVIVNNGYIPKELVFDKYGLLIVGAWNKLHPLIAGMRIESQSPEYAENFELLVSKYDNWAKKHALKTGKGERMRLRDAKTYFDYGGGSDGGVHQSSSGSG